ncbi:MAG: RNA polymerase sigma factor [Eubacterium sp.]|nr:RNA polymerase sigma factor [Eubacterium sp.]
MKGGAAPTEKNNKKKADALFKAAYEENYVSIYRYCLSKLKDHNVTEDCVQEVFLVLYKRYLAGEEIIYVKSFLMKTASNLVHKEFDKIKKQQETIDIDDVINIPSQNENIEERLTFDEYSRQISAALSTLDATIFTLRYVNEYKIEEIAKQLDMSISAVTTRLSRIRQKLRRIFDDKLK